MKLPAGLRAWPLAGAALLLAALALPARAQAPASTYEVRKGDTLYAIARSARHEKVNFNQMLTAIVRANPEAFASGSIHVLRVGQNLAIPGPAEAAAIPPDEARRAVLEMVARAAPAPVAAVSRAVPPVQTRPPAAPLGREEAARRYQEGLGLERQGNEKGAFRAFLEAAEGGDGLAQRKLGELYDTGNSAVARDYQASLRWYQKAREQGVEIPKPQARSPR